MKSPKRISGTIPHSNYRHHVFANFTQITLFVPAREGAQGSLPRAARSGWLSVYQFGEDASRNLTARQRQCISSPDGLPTLSRAKRKGLDRYHRLYMLECSDSQCFWIQVYEPNHSSCNLET